MKSQDFIRDPIRPGEESLAFMVGGLNPRKVGAGGNTGPHYFVRPLGVTTRSFISKSALVQVR